MDMTKIATCSFCGVRTILRLRRGVGLTCASCAAPLLRMKPLAAAARGGAWRPPLAWPKPRRRRRVPGVERMLDDLLARTRP